MVNNATIRNRFSDARIYSTLENDLDSDMKEENVGLSNELYLLFKAVNLLVFHPVSFHRNTDSLILNNASPMHSNLFTG